MALLLCISPARAQDCNQPPQGFGNEWWERYAQWCSACCGTPNRGTTSCSPGTNWGCRSDGNRPSVETRPALGIVRKYRDAYATVRRIIGSDLFDYREARTLADLYWMAAQLKRAARDELDRLTEIKSDLDADFERLNGEIESNSRAILELKAEISSLDRETSALERDNRRIESKIPAQRDLLSRLSNITTTMAAEILTFRKNVFDSLHQAESQGLIPPPSSYRSLPKPLPASYAAPYAKSNQVAREYSPPRLQRPYEVDTRPQMRVPSQPLRINPRLSKPEPATEEEVRDEITEALGISSRIPAVIVAIRKARDRLVEPGRQASKLSEEANVLDSRKKQLRSVKESLTAKANELNSKLDDVLFELSDRGTDASRKWVERSFWKYVDRLCKELLTHTASESHAEWFIRFRKVMTGPVLELASSVFDIIRRTQEAVVKDNWGELSVELDQTLNQFKLNLFLIYTELPKWLQQLVPKGNLPWREAD